LGKVINGAAILEKEIGEVFAAYLIPPHFLDEPPARLEVFLRLRGSSEELTTSSVESSFTEAERDRSDSRGGIIRILCLDRMGGVGGREVERGPISNGDWVAALLKKLAIETLFLTIEFGIRCCSRLDEDDGIRVWGWVAGDKERLGVSGGDCVAGLSSVRVVEDFAGSFVDP
jgi:hypothetical protein